MSWTNLAIGGTVAAVALQSLFNLALPDPKPIKVHSLNFDKVAQEVIQERTVTTEAPFFYAHWEAQVIRHDTGEVVCEGEGDWPYKPGLLAARMDVKKWSGDANCNLEPDVEYRLRAAWLWGDDQEAHKSEPFTIN